MRLPTAECKRLAVPAIQPSRACSPSTRITLRQKDSPCGWSPRSNVMLALGDDHLLTTSKIGHFSPPQTAFTLTQPDHVCHLPSPIYQDITGPATGRRTDFGQWRFLPAVPLDPLWGTTTETRTQATRLCIHPPDLLRLRELRTRPKKSALSLQQHLAFRVVVENLSGCSAITRSHDSIRQRPTIRTLANKHVVSATLSVRNDPSRFYHRSSVKLVHNLTEIAHFAQRHPDGPVLPALR